MKNTSILSYVQHGIANFYIKLHLPLYRIGVVNDDGVFSPERLKNRDQLNNILNSCNGYNSPISNCIKIPCFINKHGVSELGCNLFTFFKYSKQNFYGDLFFKTGENKISRHNSFVISIGPYLILHTEGSDTVSLLYDSYVIFFIFSDFLKFIEDKKDQIRYKVKLSSINKTKEYFNI